MARKKSIKKTSKVVVKDKECQTSPTTSPTSSPEFEKATRKEAVKNNQEKKIHFNELDYDSKNVDRGSRKSLRRGKPNDGEPTPAQLASPAPPSVKPDPDDFWARCTPAMKEAIMNDFIPVNLDLQRQMKVVEQNRLALSWEKPTQVMLKVKEKMEDRKKLQEKMTQKQRKAHFSPKKFFVPDPADPLTPAMKEQIVKKSIHDEMEKKESKTDPRAYPMANDALTTKILNLVQQASNVNQLKKVSYEVVKALNRGQAEFVIFASDAESLEMLLLIPQLCEYKKVPYVFVQSEEALGRACGVSNVVAIFSTTLGVSQSVGSACVTQNEGSKIKSEITEIQREIEKLLV